MEKRIILANVILAFLPRSTLFSHAHRIASPRIRRPDHACTQSKNRSRPCGSSERCSVHRMQPSCCILPSPQSAEVGADMTGLGWCLFVGIQAMRAYLEAHHNYEQPTVVLVAVVVSDFMLCSWLASEAAVVIK